MTNKVIPVDVTLSAGDDAELKVLRALVKRAEEGDRKALAEVRAKFDAVPAAWEPFGNVAVHAESAWIRASAGDNPLIDEAIRKTAGRLRTQLLGEAPSPLERLLVDRIVACWLQVQFADSRAAYFERTGGTLLQGQYWQRQQGRAHARYLSAIRTLAQVRRLLTPAVQVNIAQNQVNLAQ